MIRRKTEKESVARRDAPQVPKLRIEFETLVAASIAAVVTRPKKRRRRTLDARR